MLFKNDFIKSWPGICFISTPNSIVISSSQLGAELCGYKKPGELEGITYDAVKAPLAELADIFQAEDRKIVMTKEPIKCLGYINYYNEDWRLVYGYKYPLLDRDGNVSAIICCAVDATGDKVIDISRFLMETQKKYFAKPNRKQFSIILKQETSTEQLSTRELECLFFLLRGYSYKIIAKALNLSARTIEDYCLNIKRKLNCYSRSQVIEKAIHQGYLNIMPESLLNSSFI